MLARIELRLQEEHGTVAAAGTLGQLDIEDQDDTADQAGIESAVGTLPEVEYLARVGRVEH